MAKTSETINKKLLAAAISATKARDIKDLLDKGADINAHNEWGLTPVMLAAQYNHSESFSWTAAEKTYLRT